MGNGYFIQQNYNTFIDFLKHLVIPTIIVVYHLDLSFDEL